MGHRTMRHGYCHCDRPGLYYDDELRLAMCEKCGRPCNDPAGMRDQTFADLFAFVVVAAVFVFLVWITAQPGA